MNTVNVDFGKTTGRIKPLHSMCCAPYVNSYGSQQALISKYFEEAHIPYCRLHDCCGSYGGTHFIDIPNIFPDFAADVNDPDSYDFHYSDEYITAVQTAGCEAYYRLGVTIEWGSKKYTSVVPADFEKWAEICEHVILHYTKGWNNGFQYNMRYWEIWNEPENPGNAFGSSMWSGTKEEFFSLYAITSKHLRRCFPDIKIGGYGSCGFYTETRTNIPASYQAFVPYFCDFLDMVKRENCPLDFFSWHIYTGDEQELLAHAKFVRKTLDTYGFSQTESHLNEWNIHSEGSGFAGKHTMEGASFNAAVLSILQHTDYVDMAMYYCFSYTGAYNGLLNQNDKSTDAPWYSFVAFGRLYELGSCAFVETDKSKIYACAATNGKESALLLSNYNCADEDITLSVSGLAKSARITLKSLSDNKGFTQFMSFSAADKCEISFKIPKETILLMEVAEYSLD